MIKRSTPSHQQGEEVSRRFHQFSSVLFSSCIDFERSVQTREINDKLDRVIRSFLIEISAFLYMKPTKMSPPHKALEWLVRRLLFLSRINCVCYLVITVSYIACLPFTTLKLFLGSRSACQSAVGCQSFLF